jgi:hypothetical protein
VLKCLTSLITWASQLTIRTGEALSSSMLEGLQYVARVQLLPNSAMAFQVDHSKHESLFAFVGRPNVHKQPASSKGIRQPKLITPSSSFPPKHRVNMVVLTVFLSFASKEECTATAMNHEASGNLNQG